MELQDAIDQFVSQEKLTRNEGRKGVENLCRLVNAMGYQDRQYFGQFHQAGSTGDLLAFLEDNPGCLEAIHQWIADQNIPEWAESIEERLDNPFEVDEEETEE